MSAKKSLYLPRRRVLQGLLGAAAFGMATKLSSCSSSSESGSAGTTNGSLTVGFLYVGAKDDYGFNQAHAEGAAAVAQLPGVTVVEQANVPETTEAQEAMRNMIEEDGATVLFPTSFGYFDPHILRIAEEYPEVQIFHYGALYEEGVTPQNIGSYFGDVDEAQFIAGQVAALTSQRGRLGFVAAKPITPVLRNLNSFLLGARSVKPDITMQVIFTGDWAQPVKEAEATNSLADQGVDVVSMHVDSPKVIVETAERRGIYSSGFHAVQTELAPRGYLTGTAWDFPSVYSQYVEMFQSGKTLMNGGIAHLIRGGLKENFVKLAPFGPAVAEETKAKAEASVAEANAGDLVVYAGAIKDNTGNVEVPEGEIWTVTDSRLDGMNWLAEGAIGNVGG